MQFWQLKHCILIHRRVDSLSSARRRLRYIELVHPNSQLLKLNAHWCGKTTQLVEDCLDILLQHRSDCSVANVAMPLHACEVRGTMLAMIVFLRARQSIFSLLWF